MLGRPITNIETVVANEEPIGDIDGENTLFEVDHNPLEGTFKLYLNGLKLLYPDHFTVIGNQVILEDAPLTGDILICEYNY